MLSHSSCVQTFVTLRTWAACPPPGDPPNPQIEPPSFISPALAGGFLTTSATWEARLSLGLTPKSHPTWAGRELQHRARKGLAGRELAQQVSVSTQNGRWGLQLEGTPGKSSPSEDFLHQSSEAPAFTKQLWQEWPGGVSIGSISWPLSLESGWRGLFCSSFPRASLPRFAVLNPDFIPVSTHFYLGSCIMCNYLLNW